VKYQLEGDGLKREKNSGNVDYINYIRDRMGSDPVIFVGAVVVAVNRHGALLLQQRSDNGQWSFPGGMLEMGEALEDAAKREFKEETGRNISNLSLLSVASGKNHFYEYPNGDQVWNVTAIYACSLDGTTFELADETLRLQ